MMLRYLFLVFLLGITSGRCLDPGGHDLNNSGLISPSDSSSRYNPCEKTKMEKRAADANYACHDECMTLQKEISSTYEANPKTMKLLYISCGQVTQGQCSTVARVPICLCITPRAFKGQRKTILQVCRHGMQALRTFTGSGTNSASQALVKNTMQRANSQDFGGSEIVEAVGMTDWGRKRRRSGRGLPQPPPPPAAPQRTSSSSSPASSGNRSSAARQRTSSSPSPASSGNRSSAARQRTSYSSSSPSPASSGNRSSPGPRSPSSVAGPSSSLGALTSGSPPDDFNTRRDNLPEGDTLYTYVRVKGTDVAAIVDTGAAFTVIHRNHANGMVDSEDQELAGADGQQFTIHGKTTISLEVREGIFIPVTGVVTDLKQEIILGSDFFKAHKTIIRLYDRWMDIFIGQEKVPMMIRFRSIRSEISMTNSDTGRYMPLRIAVSLNEQPRLMLVDTGAAVTVVKRSCVNDSAISFVHSTCTVAGGASANFVGTTFLMLKFGVLSVFQQAKVPAFEMPADILGGNDFNKQYIEKVDYGIEKVFLRFLGPEGVSRISTPALIYRDKKPSI